MKSKKCVLCKHFKVIDRYCSKHDLKNIQVVLCGEFSDRISNNEKSIFDAPGQWTTEPGKTLSFVEKNLI